MPGIVEQLSPIVRCARTVETTVLLCMPGKSHWSHRSHSSHGTDRTDGTYGTHAKESIVDRDMTSNNVKFLVFDVESVADGQLVSKIRFPGEMLGPQQAIRKYRDELIEKNGTDFIPYSYQVPVSVVVGKVTSDLRLIDLVALDEPQFRPHILTEKFWRGWETYRRPTLVSFNGRSFDIPLLELSAFRFGVSMPGWMDAKGPNYQQPRYRYNPGSHLDLYDVLTNFGATRLSGGLNLAATLLGKPGKMDVQGHMVQDLFDAGNSRRSMTIAGAMCWTPISFFCEPWWSWGQLTLDREHELVAETKQWLLDRIDQSPGYRSYLDRWGDWCNPWVESQNA